MLAAKESRHFISLRKHSLQSSNPGMDCLLNRLLPFEISFYLSLTTDYFKD